jgi:hypothetical protein
MPHDSPSISPSDSAAEGTSTKAAMPVMPATPMATPTSAVAMGSPAATTAPKVISRMTNAAMTPKISGMSGMLNRKPG